MRHVMFDIDGTLVESYDFDSLCFAEAVKTVTGIDIDTNWARYKHVTDAGILNEFLEENNVLDTANIRFEIKKVFLEKIKAIIAKKPVKEVCGASEFLLMLQTFNEVKISFATGGWYESAILKLVSAGIDFSDIPIASSNDYHSRIEIMKLAQNLATGSAVIPFTYFGDGDWDLKACAALDANFVLVGDKFEHQQSIKDFTDQRAILNYIGLECL